MGGQAGRSANTLSFGTHGCSSSHLLQSLSSPTLRAFLALFSSSDLEFFIEKRRPDQIPACNGNGLSLSAFSDSIMFAVLSELPVLAPAATWMQTTLTFALKLIRRRTA